MYLRYILVVHLNANFYININYILKSCFYSSLFYQCVNPFSFFAIGSLKVQRRSTVIFSLSLHMKVVNEPTH
jgi:hypothetical protein